MVKNANGHSTFSYFVTIVNCYSVPSQVAYAYFFLFEIVVLTGSANNTKSSSFFLLDGPEFRSSLYQDVPRKKEPLNIVIFVGGETVQPTGSAAQDWLLPAVRVRLQGCRLSSPQVLLPPHHHKIQCSYM